MSIQYVAYKTAHMNEEFTKRREKRVHLPEFIITSE